VIGGTRFLAEIRTTANLQHPHILALSDSGESDGSVSCVMPFVAGESLRDRLNREKQLPVDDALRIATEVADALDYAHRQGRSSRSCNSFRRVLMAPGATHYCFRARTQWSRATGQTIVVG
jgi:serine/threonine protein kinase